jgi:hypothetical protein
LAVLARWPVIVANTPYVVTGSPQSGHRKGCRLAIARAIEK